MSRLSSLVMSAFHHPIVGTMGLRGAAILMKSVQVVILVRLYGVESYGVYAVGMGIFILTSVFGRLGLDHFSLREANQRDHSAYRATIGISFWIAVPSLLASLGAYVVTLRFYSPEVSRVFGVFVAVAPIYAVMWNQLFVLRGAGWVNTSLVLFEIFNPLILLGAAYVLRGAELGLAYSFLVASVATSLFTYFRGIRHLCDPLPPCFGSISTMKVAVVASRSFYAASILEAVRSLADSLAVGFFLRTVDAAFYAIITRVTGLVQMPIAVMTIYMNNTVARLRAEPISKILEAMRPFILVNLSISAVVSLAIIFALPLIDMLFKVELPKDAKWAYVAVVAAHFVTGATAFVRSAMFMSGRERNVSRTLLYVTIPYLVVLVLVTEKFGLLSVGIAYFIYTLLTQAILVAILVSEVWRARDVDC